MFGWKAAEYLYIIFVSTVFTYATIKFAETMHVKKELFYAFMLNPFVLIMGLNVGTELIALALLELFIISIVKKTIKSGIWFGLMALTRYNFVLFFPLLLFLRSFKHITLAIILMVSLFLPWFAYNYYASDNMLTSIGNSYALNVKFRDYLNEAPHMVDILIVGNYLIVFGLLGIYKKNNIIMFLTLLIVLSLYVITPVKEARYLFPFILPLSYFTYYTIQKADVYKIIMLNIFIMVALFLLMPIEYFVLMNEKNYPVYQAECMTTSNLWVYLNYHGVPSYPEIRKEEYKNYIEDGYRIVLYKYVHNKPNVVRYPVIEENEFFVVIGKNETCKEFENVTEPYLIRLNRTISRLKNKSIETDPCVILIKNRELCKVFGS